MVDLKNTREYFAGSIASAIQTTIVYPLDTLKVYRQTNSCMKGIVNVSNIRNLKNTIDIRKIYSGIKYPLLFDTFAGSLLFGTYYNMRREYSAECSSLVTGIIVGTVTNPFDIYKIKYQLQKSARNISLLRGIHLTILRESLGNYVYFGSYEYFKERSYGIPVAGGLAGGLMWTAVYPIDNIKTNYQINPNEDVWTIIKKRKGKMYSGYSYAMMRGVPANAIVFYVFELVYKYI